MKQALQTIDFYGSRIYTVDKDGEHYVAMKPICESIGIDWEGQRQRIMRHPVLKSTACMIKAVAEDGKKRELLMLPVEMLNGWLFLIDSNKVNTSSKNKVVKYQKECFKVLNQYWQNKSQLGQVDTSSTAACFSDLHVFIELTRGRLAISKLGTPYNSVSIPTAQVLQFLYNKPCVDQGAYISARKIAQELKIARTGVGRSLVRLEKWHFLIKRPFVGAGKPHWICLNRKRVDEALQSSKNSLLANQQQTGYLVN